MRRAEGLDAELVELAQDKQAAKYTKVLTAIVTRMKD